MEDKSNLLVLLLILMMGTFSLVLIFKGDFQRGVQIAKEEEEQKAERQIARKEKEEKYAIKWKPSAPAESKRAPAAAPAAEIARGPVISQEIYHADREPLSRTVVENEQGHRMVADELLLSFKQGVTQEEIENLERQYQLTLISYLPAIGLARFQTAAGTDLSRLKEQISKENANIRYSEENYVATLGVLPDDAGDAWFFKNVSPVPGVKDFDRAFGDKNIRSTSNIDVGKGRFADGFSLTPPPLPDCALVAVVDSSFNTINHSEFNTFEAGSKAFAPEPPHDDPKMNSLNPNAFNLLDRLTNVAGGHRDQLATKNNEISKILQNPTDPLGLFELVRDSTFRDPNQDPKVIAKNKELNDKFVPFSSLHSDLTHGIEVTSLIGANQDNTFGTAGLCASRLLRAIQVARLNQDAQGNLIGILIDSATTVAGIGHAVNQAPPVKVINISLVFDGPRNECPPGSGNFVLSPCSIYDALLDASLKGAVIVAAAGNDGKDIKTEKPRSPATLSQAIRTLIAVGAVRPGAFDEQRNPSTLIAPFSNTSNELVTLGAPGTFIKVPTQRISGAEDLELNRIFGTAHVRTKNLTTPTGAFNAEMRKYSPHEFVDGTSSAAPLVSAVAAMIYKKIEGRPEFVGKPPSDIAATVKTLISQNVQKVAGLETKFQTGGIVDAVAALAAADDPNKLNAAITATPIQIVAAVPTPTGQQSGGGIVGIGGGCGSIESNTPPWNNLPMIVIFVIPLFVLFRRRFVFGRMRKR